MQIARLAWFTRLIQLTAPTLLAAACGPAFAQTVSMSGSLGDKALLIIDGTPRTLATGATVQGVKLIRVGGGDAVVEVKGQRLTLLLGGAQINIGGKPSDGGGTQIVLSATTGGHFRTQGTINGKSVQFMVDTGATFVSMGIEEAQWLGVDMSAGRRVTLNTANGQAIGYRVKLASVQIGDVVLYDIDGIVSREPMQAILLGNSYLAHFQMKRENDQLTLVRRY